MYIHKPNKSRLAENHYATDTQKTWKCHEHKITSVIRLFRVDRHSRAGENPQTVPIYTAHGSSPARGSRSKH
jgi:hypothetical protein